MSSQRDFKPREKGKKPRQGAPLWIWLLTITLLALLVSGLVYLSKGSNQDTRPVANSAPPAATPATVEDEEPTTATPRFQFYDMLPNMEITVPEPAGNDANTPSLRKKPVYYLQAGSFRTFEQADTRKAQLALIGLESSIQTVDVNGKSVHRVRLGPYHSRRKADVVLRHIHENRGEAIMLRR